MVVVEMVVVESRQEPGLFRRVEATRFRLMPLTKRRVERFNKRVR